MTSLRGEPRIPLRPKADWDDEAKSVLADLYRSDSPLSNLALTLAHHPDLMINVGSATSYLKAGKTLPPAVRELAILRTSWRCHCQYMWALHVDIGRAAGLEAADIQRITEEVAAHPWLPERRAALVATDELVHDCDIGESTWASLSAHWSPPQMIELIYTVGQYVTTAMVLNALRVPLDGDGDGEQR